MVTMMHDLDAAHEQRRLHYPAVSSDLHGTVSTSTTPLRLPLDRCRPLGTRFVSSSSAEPPTGMNCVGNLLAVGGDSSLILHPSTVPALCRYWHKPPPDTVGQAGATQPGGDFQHMCCN